MRQQIRGCCAPICVRSFNSLFEMPGEARRSWSRWQVLKPFNSLFEMREEELGLSVPFAYSVFQFSI